MQLNSVHPRSRQRGIGLIDALIAVSMLAFGLLGLSRMQARLVAQSSESQVRLAATRAASELMGFVQIDGSNVGCYVLPEPTGCASTVASTGAARWKASALALLPTHAGTVATVKSTLDASTGRFQVVLTWPAKGSRLGDQLNTDTHKLTVATDVRR